jgi:hypothetical protein
LGRVAENGSVVTTGGGSSLTGFGFEAADTRRQRVAIVLNGAGQETDEGELLVIGKVKRQIHHTASSVTGERYAQDGSQKSISLTSALNASLANS